MDKVLILAVLGMSGSGKSTVVQYITTRNNVPSIRFGSIIYDEVRRRGLDIVKDEKIVREDMRAKEGKAVVAKRVAERVRDLIAQGHDKIVLDGLYSWSEFKYLDEIFGDQLITMAVVTPRQARWQRVAARQDKIDDRHYTEQQVKIRDIAEIENLEKGGPIAYANYFVLNNKTVGNLQQQIDEILQEIVF